MNMLGLGGGEGTKANMTEKVKEPSRLRGWV